MVNKVNLLRSVLRGTRHARSGMPIANRAASRLLNAVTPPIIDHDLYISASHRQHARCACKTQPLLAVRYPLSATRFARHEENR
jgi:hypothetical protein